MSETVLAPAASSRGHVVPVRRSRSRLNALEALERGFALFRSTFVTEAWRYYLGSAPLVLCFIPIWVVNGQIRISDGAVLAESALLTVSYVFRVWMVATYMQRVRQRAFGIPATKPAGAIAHAAALGRLLAWKILLSVAVLATLLTFAGAPWFYTACQFASVEARDDSGERHSMRGCLAIATQWFGGSLLLFVMLFPLWIAVWLNGLIIAMLVPQLLHSILGVNTVLSTPAGIFALIRSSAFWVSLFGGAWLALDPVVKCSYMVVYQHLRSTREGDDLRGLLTGLPREQQKKAQMTTPATVKLGVALTIVGAVVLSASQFAHAQQLAPNQAPTLADSARPLRVQQLRQALNIESRRPIYRWHDAEHPSQPNWFDKLLAKIGHAIQRAWNALWDFLRKLWPRGVNLFPAGGGAWHLENLRVWLLSLAILTIAAGGVLVWLRRRRETASISVSQVIASVPDLTEDALASVRSEDEWFALAGRLEETGELRLALRAAYLGLLAGLAEREWLTIRRDRTNREYLDEFTRRWRRRPQAVLESRAEIPEKLRGSLRQFDRVWYGSDFLTPAAVTAYRLHQQEFLTHV